PAEVFAEYRGAGVGQVVCEEKHMGSRAIAVVCRDSARFGVDGPGAIYTRTGRAFLDDDGPALERLRAAVERAGLFDGLGSDWVVLDCEILPWSAKAADLIERQYAAVGGAAASALGATVGVLDAAAARGLNVAELRSRTADRLDRVERYRGAYERYSWP